MTIFVSHISALEFWRSPAAPANPIACRVERAPDRYFSQRAIQSFGEFASTYAITTPAHFAVANRAARGKSACARFHVWGNRSTAGLFVRVSKDVLVASPELCFVQMATSLSLIELIALGFELTGSYAGTRFDRAKPLTTLAKLNACMLKLSGIHGRKKAVRALRYIQENSASPRETALAMLLALPRRMGGYGIPRATLNAPIRRTHIVAQRQNRNHHGTNPKRTFRCDLLWPDRKVAVEYDSDSFHTGAQSICRDAERRNELLSQGIAVITITNGQIINAHALDEAVGRIVKLCRFRIRKRANEYLMKRYALRKTLLQSWSGTPIV